jgi:hypothetical protein
VLPPCSGEFHADFPGICITNVDLPGVAVNEPLTEFRDSRYSVFACCAGETSARNNQKQNTVTLSVRSGGELKSRGCGRITGAARAVSAGFELELAGAER